MGDLLPINSDIAAQLALETASTPEPILTPEEADLEIDALVANLQVLSGPVPVDPPDTFGERAAQRQTDRQELFTELVDLTYRDIYNTSYRYCTSLENLEDTLQEIYRRAWVHFDKFEGKSKFTTWLHRIAVNTAISQEEKHRRYRTNPASWILHREQQTKLTADDKLVALPGADKLPSHRGEEAFAAVDTAQSFRGPLREALAQLPPKTRAVVILFTVEDLSHATIGEYLGLKEGAVKVRYHRGMTKLREILDPNLTNEKDLF